MPPACDPVFRTSVPMIVMRVSKAYGQPAPQYSCRPACSPPLAPAASSRGVETHSASRSLAVDLNGRSQPIDSGPMSVYNMCIVLCLLALSPRGPALGQSQAGDSTVRSPRDSSPIKADSAATSGSTGDNASSADTIRSASDTSQPATGEKPAGAPGEQGGRDTAGARGAVDSIKPGAVDSIKPAAAATPLPTDSILSTACSASAGPTSTAPDLLVVIFTAETGSADRAAVAKSVKGRLLGQAVSEPGAYYLWVPAEGQEHRLRAAADQLVRSPAVRQVGSRACPPAVPADTTRPGPTTQPLPER